MVNYSDHRIHILVLPYPSQGHINPLFQFAKVLAGHSGVRCTLALTRFVANSAKAAGITGSVHVAVFSDGCDDVGPDGVGGHRGPYFERLNAAGPVSVDRLLRSESELGRPVHGVVYDAFLPWAQGVARLHGAACAAFFTQTCAVDVLYTHLRAGRIPTPPVREAELPPELDGLPSQLELSDLPTFMVDKNRPPGLLELLMNQFVGLDTVDHVLVNSFHDLEPQVSSAHVHARMNMTSHWLPN
jgi:pathogen-inducible salicylic acid glucosyltransferase